ncbi:MAG: glycosyltransferase [Methyloprofundus sp.]|nr:glycosyltransferase [Methyloprofundus sp.]
MKKIAIAIPTYNRNDLLERLVKTIPNYISIFVSDNGSFVTPEIETQFNNIKVHKHSKVISIFENWNSALSAVNDCDYLAIPSDDDLYISDQLKTIRAIIDNNDADVFVFGNHFINEQDQITGSFCPEKLEIFESPNGFRKFMFGVDVRMPSVFFKKSFLDKLGYFDEKLFTLTAADSELVQRALLTGKVIFVPEIVSSYRVWSGSLTDQRIASAHWMSEVDAWTNKISSLAFVRLNNVIYSSFNWKQYKDEIYARNLLAGMSNLYKAKKYEESMTHFKAMRYPKHALLKTKLRILKHLVVCSVKRLYAN